MAKQVQRAIGWVAAFLLAVGMLFLPVSKAYAGPVRAAVLEVER